MALLCCSKRQKKTTKSSNKQNHQATMLSIPRELILEILGHVASSQSTDFFNARQSCREIWKVADDDYLYRRMSLERFPCIQWHENKRVTSFLDRCKESGNPEALYRQGVIEYFSFSKVESGLDYLRRAADLGHYGAAYVLGVILLCTDENVRHEAMKLLDGVKGTKRIGESRRELKNILGNIWVNNPSLGRMLPSNNCPARDQHRERQGWPRLNVDMDDGLPLCLECSCSNEVAFVCNALRGKLSS